MPITNRDSEFNFVVGRLINQTNTAEGSNLPPKQSGDIRVPIVRNLKLIKSIRYFGGTQFTLSWESPPDDQQRISHYTVYIFGLLSGNQQPLAPTAVTGSPAEVRVTSNEIATVTFRVQTVLKNGQVSELTKSPTCAGSTAPPSLEETDFTDDTIPADALIGDIPTDKLEDGDDFVRGALTLLTGGIGYIPVITAAGTIGQPAVPLLVTQATLGNEVARTVSTASNDDPVEKVYQNKVTTTNATVTTLHTLAIPSSTTVGIHGFVTARRTGGSSGTAEDSSFWEIKSVFKNVAGTATAVSSGAPALIGQDDGTGWDLTLTPSSGNILIQVTGLANVNISWVLTLKTYPIST